MLQAIKASKSPPAEVTTAWDQRTWEIRATNCSIWDIVTICFTTLLRTPRAAQV